VVKRHPAGAGGGIEHCIEEGPVGDGVRPILHAFRLAVGGGNRTGVEVVAPNDERGVHLAVLDEPVKAFAHLGPLAVLQPADSRREALELHVLARLLDPAMECWLVGEGVEYCVVGDGDVFRVAREGGPAEGARAPTEKGTNERRDEAGKVERLLHVAEVGHLAAQVVAVVECDGALRLHVQHGLHMRLHRVEDGLLVAVRVVLAKRGGLLHRVADRNVARLQVVRGGLIGENIRHHVTAHQLGEHLGDVADEPDRMGAVLCLRGEHFVERFIQVRAQLVAVSGFHSPFDASGVDLHAQECPAGHRCGQRLRSAHLAKARSQHKSSLQGAVEVLARALGERLERALQDSLRADVDPGARRHLAIHREAHLLQAAKLVPVRPAGDEVRVGDQHAGGLRMGAENTDRLATLNEQGLVILQPLQRLYDRVVAVPVSGGLARAAVHDELVRIFGHLRIQVVHEHAQGALLLPALAVEVGAGWGVDGSRWGSRHGTRGGRCGECDSAKKLRGSRRCGRGAPGSSFPHRRGSRA